MRSIEASERLSVKRWPRSYGFTLIELLVAISIAAILTALAAPSFSGAILSSKLTSYSVNFVASAQLARSEALKRNAVVRLCRSANGTTCATSGTWQQGWIVIADTGGSAIQVQQPLSPDFIFSGDSYNVAFQPSGGIPSMVSLVLCRVSPSAGNQERQVRISPTGRITVEKSFAGVCA